MKYQYVQVAVNIPQVSGVFDYHIPEDLDGEIQPGCLVVVPFGSRNVQGVVLRKVAQPQVSETRAVHALIDVEPILTAGQIKFAQWLSERTLAPLSMCLDVMIPPGLSQQADMIYHLNDSRVEQLGKLNELQKRAIALLKERGDLRGRQLEAAFPRKNWKPAVQALVRMGVLMSRPVLLPPSVQPKTVRNARLAIPAQEIDQQISKLGRSGSPAAERRLLALRALAEEETESMDVSWLYAASGANAADLKYLEKQGLIFFGESEVIRDPLKDIQWVAVEPPPLTLAQKKVWEEIYQAIHQSVPGKPGIPFLLHGVTGSGKTEMYLLAVEETLRKGRQAIVLVPEISLTPQTVRRFQSRFPGKVGLIHSRLSAGERYDTWRRARAGLLQVIVGPRSALFTPFKDVGLVVVDECHDESYYQSEGQPHYNAVAAAVAMARESGAVAILGSATPDVSMLYGFTLAKWKILSLPDRILAHRQAVREQMNALGLPEPVLEGNETTANLPMPAVKVVDMRLELKMGNRSIFSRELTQAIEQTLAAKQQAILFLNRRGTATYVFCRDCGATLKCPRCDLPLTYHRGDESLVCHTCAYRRKMPQKCPACAGTQIGQYGTGTEKVESLLKQQFPQANVLRFDAETTQGKNNHDILLNLFANHQADILIGTQMLTKGLDLPLVTLVGIILADVGLNFPDYRAAERTFQLLSQVAGRAGRSPLGGRVILQTFQPKHYVIQTAARHDYQGFYEEELAQRRRLHQPPFARFIRLLYRDLNAGRAEQSAREMAAQLRRWIAESNARQTDLIGPAPCFFNRLNGYYRWQIIVRGPDPAGLLRDRSLGDWQIEVDPPNIL